MSLDAIPVWAAFLGIFLIVLVSIEGGYLLGRLAHKRSELEKESPVSVMSASVLGLGAFVLAFTFGMVANRFEARKELVRDEANAIRTAWLRSDFLPEPDRAEAKAIIQRYLAERLALVQTGLASEPVESFHAKAERDQARLWEMAVANARIDMNSDVAALYIDSLNDVFEVHDLRVAIGLETRLPKGIWAVLLVLTALGMIVVGYQTGIAGSKRSKAGAILAVSFAMVIALIADLDRAGGGVIRVTQQPLINVYSQITDESSLPTPNKNEP